VLSGFGARGEVRELDASTRTARDAAAALGCDVGAIASTLVFMADGEPVLILTSGAHRVDVTRVGALLGAGELRQATPDEVRTATGYAIGGVAPVGHPQVLRTLVDEDLRRYPVLWAAAGTGHSVFSTTFDELVAISGGELAKVA
jgi:prolyl-tRNA editing enzyme YbaK/EbsC (Cys-tRNA(Pro) deacylase)